VLRREDAHSAGHGFRIVTPEQSDALYAALPDEATRLLVETAVHSGLRWGELTDCAARTSMHRAAS
jgi:hypothetical protein